jgi:hypothetical protein
MSIDWLFELERAVDSGREMFACPGLGKNQWVVSKTLDELQKVARRAADQKKIPVNIVRIIPKQDAVAGDLFLVPVNVGDPGARGEPQVEWKVFDTKEAAEMMRDVRQGPAPFFGAQIQETMNPAGA